MADQTSEETGHRLAQVTFNVIGDGRHTIFDLGIVDRDTREPKPSVRFFTNYEGLGALVATLHQAARMSVDALVKSGAAADLTKELRQIVVTHIQSCSVGVSTDKTTVSLQIQTMEGHLESFAIDPETARKLAKSLAEVAGQTKPKSGLN